MTDSLLEQAAAMAKLHGLDPKLVCAVIEQESNWDTYAMRYEPAFYVRYVLKIPNLTDTERQARSTSWGLMQTMGQIAREEGFTQKFLSSLCDPDFGLQIGCKKLKRCLDACNGDEAQALLRWNGGANHEYPMQVLARKEHYNV